jgi:hypothetical protein
MSDRLESGDSPPHDQDASGQGKSISIEALADRVYRLMLREIRAERARGQRGTRRGKE